MSARQSASIHRAAERQGLLGNLYTVRRILTQLDRGKGLFHVPPNEPATTTLVVGSLYSEALELLCLVLLR